MAFNRWIHYLDYENGFENALQPLHCGKQQNVDILRVVPACTMKYAIYALNYENNLMKIPYLF